MVTGVSADLANPSNKPVRNCELKEPSIEISFGCNGPCMLIGSFPAFEVTATPNCGKISSKKSIGRFNKLPSPLIVIGFDDNAAMGVNIRMPNPLSPQLTTSSNGSTPLL